MLSDGQELSWLGLGPFALRGCVAVASSRWRAWTVRDAPSRELNDNYYYKEVRTRQNDCSR
jgi:hypothetical protein